MITQARFDTAYEKIAHLRDRATQERRGFFSDRVLQQNSDHYKASGMDRAFTQALAILEDADREEPGPAACKNPKVKPKWIGCWVVAWLGDEMMQWGKDGDTVLPYDNYDEAWAQAEYLATHPYSCGGYHRPYIFNIFSNGQVRTDEYEKGAKPRSPDTEYLGVRGCVGCDDDICDCCEDT